MSTVLLSEVTLNNTGVTLLSTLSVTYNTLLVLVAISGMKDEFKDEPVEQGCDVAKLTIS